MGLKCCLAFIGPAGRSSSLHANVMVALVPVPGCSVRDVDRRELVQVSAIFFCPSMGLLRMSILFILLPPDYDGALYSFSMLLFWHPMLSNGLVASESRRVSCPLSDSFEQDKRHKNRRPNLPANVSSINDTGRFGSSVPSRTARCCPFHG